MDREIKKGLIPIFIALSCAALMIVSGCGAGTGSEGENGDTGVATGILVLGANADDELAIKKYDTSGTEDTENWNKTLSGVTGYWYAACGDSNNNVYLVYYSNGGLKALKYDYNGSEDTDNWGFELPYSPTLYVEACVDQDDNVYFAGSDGGASAEQKWIVKKYSPDGTEDTAGFWNDPYDQGYGHCAANAVACDPYNVIYVAGMGMNTESGDNNNNKWHIKKFDTAGNEITGNWPYLGLEGSYHAIDAIAFDSDKNIYAVGITSTGWQIKKFDSSGVEDTDWDITVPIISSYGAVSVSIDNSNNVYVLGYDNNGADIDIMLKRYLPDASEDAAWNKIMDSGGNDRPHQVMVDGNGDAYIAGHDKDSNFWLRKYNKDGDMAWEKTTDFKCTCGNISTQNMVLLY